MKPARSVSISIPLPECLRVPIDFGKDLQVLLPITVWGLVVMLLAVRWGGAIHQVAYVISCSALGAIAAGHDYTYRTAGWMFSLPFNRAKIWNRRLLLVAALILPMAFLNFILIALSNLFGGESTSPPIYLEALALYIFAPAFGGLCLAPWLTLISRSPMFGTVFSVGAPYAVLALLARFEKLDLLYAVISVLWISGLILGARKFRTLEIIDSAITNTITLPRASAKSFRRRSRIVQLFKKELMLQRLPISLAFLCIFFALLLKSDYAQLWTLAYPVALILLIASIASADERQMGTAEWQIQVPVAFWKQWLIKFTVVWGLAFVVGLVLPIAVLLFKSNEIKNLSLNNGLLTVPLFLSASFLTVVITLYISSLCNSGLKALLTALVVNSLVAVAISRMYDFVDHYIRMRRTWSLRFPGDTYHWEYGLFLIALLGFVALAFHFSLNNHRYAERGPRRVFQQVATFAAYQTIATICLLTIFGWRQ